MSPSGRIHGVPPEGYLDASSGEPLDPTARDALLAAADQGWADPDAVTPPSRRARILADGARASLASALGVAREEIYPVHGDPAAAALQQILDRNQPHLILSAVEREPIQRWSMERPSTIVPVDHLGRIDMEFLAKALADWGSRAVLSVQAANIEVGTLQPIQEISALAAASGAALHVDYHGALGRVPLVPATYISAAAPSWGGPRGIGVVVAGPQAPTSHLLRSAEGLSLPLLVAAAAALEGRVADGGSEDDRLRALIDRVRHALATIPNTEVIGDPVERLPHVLTASFLYLDGQVVMDSLASHGIYIGSGSACVATRVEPSHVLKAMGRLTHGNIRLALPHGTREQDIDRLIALLPGTIGALRARFGVK